MGSEQWFALRSAAALISTTLIQMLVMAAIGAIFGIIIGRRPMRYGEGALWGAACGVVWWLSESAIALAFGVSALAERLYPLRLFTYLAYGLALSVLIVRLSRRT